MPNPTAPYIRLFQIVPIIIFLALWQFIVQDNPSLSFFFGSPLKIYSYIVSKTLDGSLVIDFSATFFEALTGFIIGNILGTVLGLSLWYSKTIFLISRPYIIALGSAPIFAFAPLLIIWFGTGLIAKIIISALSTVFIALLQAYTGASEVRNEYIQLMKTFGATKNQIFGKIIAPSSIVWVISGFKLNIGFALLGAFIGEFISSSYGLGHMILVASGLFDISLVLTGVLLLVAIAFTFSYVISMIEQPLKRLVVKNL